MEGQTKMEKWSHTLGQGSRGVMRAAGRKEQEQQQEQEQELELEQEKEQEQDNKENFNQCIYY